MENRSHALATGAFIVLLGLSLIIVVAWFQGDHSEHVDYVVVSQNGVQGLNVKAPVKLRGVQIGQVASIAFDPEQPRQILVDITVLKSAPVTATTAAKLGYQGITGLSFIDLSDEGSGAATPRPPDSRIELRPSMLDQLASNGPRLLAGVGEVATRLNQVLSDENQKQLARSLNHLGDASASVAQLAQELRPAVASLQPLAARADGVLQRADGVIAGAGRTLQKFDGLASESTLLAQDLRQRTVALDRLAAAANQLQTTTARLELALLGADKPRTQPLVDTLGASALSVERAAATVGSLAEQPQSVLFGRPATPPGPGEPGFDATGKGR